MGAGFGYFNGLGHANYVTHLQDGAYSSYVWRVTLHNGRQLLIQMTESNGRVAGFHLT
ncbi:hypothetical protein [Acidithiobacillus ferrianus]|uniref:hypothetical protein n=1 Tax=Acidithiobacillus ferrianus TaxID=2678518 RepID=UPI0034E3D836